MLKSQESEYISIPFFFTNHKKAFTTSPADGANSEYVDKDA